MMIFEHYCRKPGAAQALFEAVVLASAVLITNCFFFPKDPGLLKWSLHPSHVITALLMLRYGVVAGIVAAPVTALAHIAGVFLLLPPWEGQAGLLRYIEPLAALIPLTLLLAAGVRRNSKALHEQVTARQALEAANATLRAKAEKVGAVNEELGRRIVSADVTFGSLYECAKRLNAHDVEAVCNGLVEVVRGLLGASTVSVWQPTESRLRLVAAHRAHGAEGHVPPIDWLRPHLDARGVVSAADLPRGPVPNGTPVVLVELRTEQGEPLAYLAVEDLPFARLNSYTIDMLAKLGDWASASLQTATRCQRLPRRLESVPASSSVPDSRAFGHLPRRRTRSRVARSRRTQGREAL